MKKTRNYPEALNRGKAKGLQLATTKLMEKIRDGEFGIADRDTWSDKQTVEHTLNILCFKQRQRFVGWALCERWRYETWSSHDAISYYAKMTAVYNRTTHAHAKGGKIYFLSYLYKHARVHKCEGYCFVVRKRVNARVLACVILLHLFKFSVSCSRVSPFIILAALLKASLILSVCSTVWLI